MLSQHTHTEYLNPANQTHSFIFANCSYAASYSCLNSKLFQDYDSDEKFPISDDKISHLLPTSYQDMIVRVYSKKAELVCGRTGVYMLQVIYAISFTLILPSNDRIVCYVNRLE